jgi:hypothetical protein
VKFYLKNIAHEKNTFNTTDMAVLRHLWHLQFLFLLLVFGTVLAEQMPFPHVSVGQNITASTYTYVCAQLGILISN